MSDPSPTRPPFEVVALAASAGGLQAVSAVLAALPAGFPAAIVLVQHLDPHHRSLMAEILGRRTPLTVRQAAPGDRIAAGTVLIAAPGHHLLVDGDGSLSLTRTDPVHFVRPSADLLFGSMAAGFGARSIAVVLTGTGVDGQAGVRAVKASGGTVIAQDRATSGHFGMPGAAIQTGCVDRVLPLDAIAPTLLALVRGEDVR